MVAQQKRPCVSVLMPVYRTDRSFLQAAIASVLEQTFADLELLLLDDCPDNPREDIVRKFDDPRIVYVRNERNLGISESRNKLLDMARGEFAAVLDHDDVSRPDRLARQVAYLREHPEVGVVGAWTREVPRNRIVRHPVEDADIRVSLMGSCAMAHTAAMLRLSVIREHGIRYQAAFSPAEDMCLFLDLLRVTKFHNIPEPLVDYRFHADNTTKRQKAQMDDAAVRVRAYAKRLHPETWADFRARAVETTRVRLLGVIPFLRIERRGNVGVVKLFDCLPIAKFKVSFKMKRPDATTSIGLRGVGGGK